MNDDWKKKTELEKINIKKQGDIENLSDFVIYEVDCEDYKIKIQDLNKNRFTTQPFFQRNPVWDNERKSRLIESIIRNMPIPYIYTYTDIVTGEEIVIDGQQRLNTILEFMDNRLILNGLEGVYLNGNYFYDLGDTYKSTFLNYKIPVSNLKKIKDKKIILDIYSRYNTGSVPLNPQEIRHCVFSGPYNDLIRELADYAPFKELFRHLKVDRMEKEEFVLRFAALYENYDNYSTNNQDFLNKHYISKAKLHDGVSAEFEEEAKKLKKAFKKSVDDCISVFGKNAFKSFVKKEKQNRSSVGIYRHLSKAVFDMQMLGFTDADSASICRNAAGIQKKFENLVTSVPEMRPNSNRMSKKASRYRNENWKQCVNDIINV